MRTYLRWISIAALLAGLALPHVAAAAPVTNVQPPAGPPGTRFLFFASEFGSVEHIDIWLNAPDGRVVAARSPELGRSTVNGDASWTWTAPDNAALGAWQMVAHGHDTKIERVIPFTIGQPAPPASAGQPYGVYPANGPAGTLFRFFANGFRDREPIDVSVVGPAGRLKSPSITTSPAGVAAPGGRVDGGWTSPRDAAPGAWQIVVHVNDSGVTRTIP
ncbi:MAG TPA: hypothetical protein VF897_16405, partial [Roseiflexaceae bacterium]